MSSIIGPRNTELSVLSGQMYQTEEALTIGLVDAYAKDAVEAESKVYSYLQNINKASGRYFRKVLNILSRSMMQIPRAFIRLLTLFDQLLRFASEQKHCC